jgi:hypothetical protein
MSPGNSGYAVQVLLLDCPILHLIPHLWSLELYFVDRLMVLRRKKESASGKTTEGFCVMRMCSGFSRNGSAQVRRHGIGYRNRGWWQYDILPERSPDWSLKTSPPMINVAPTSLGEWLFWSFLLKRRVFHVGVIVMVYKMYLQLYCNGMVATPCKQKTIFI